MKTTCDLQKMTKVFVVVDNCGTTRHMHSSYCVRSTFSIVFFLMYVVGYCFIVMFNTEIVHALMACNAGTELTCISNIEKHVKLQNMPVLSYILQRWV